MKLLSLNFKSWALAASLTLAAPFGTMAQNVSNTFDRNIPTECRDKLKGFAQAGHQIRCVAFPPAGGNRWTLVSDQGFFNRGVPQECHEKMIELRNAGHRILCVAYPPAGGNSWSIVTNKSFFNRGIPQECHEKMIAFKNNGDNPIWVAFPPAGGNRWSVITSKGAFFNRGIPQECHDKMREFSSAGHRVRSVAFPRQGGNRWTITTNKGFFNRGVPDECHRVMRAMTHCLGSAIRMVAYDSDQNGFVVISNADPMGVEAVLQDANDENNALLSLDTFHDKLKAEFEGRVGKYAYVIRYGNAVRSAANGWKRTASNPPAQKFSIYDRFNPASVSKTITALAVLHALEAKNLSVHSLIHPYLPKSWSIPASVKEITFAEVLRHRSGFRNATYGSGYDTYAGLKAIVAAGVNEADKGYDYENVNYALARILVAYLDGYQGSFLSVLEPVATAQRFNDYLNKHIFGPIGVTPVLCKPDENEETRFYPYPAGNSQGTTYGDWTLKAGGAGIHVSIAELSILLDRLSSSQTILSTSMREQMDQIHLGWDKTGSTDKGKYRSKGGYFPGSWNGGAELRSIIMKFENGIEVAAVYNGYKLKDEYGVGGAVIRAYEDSWFSVPKLSFKRLPGGSEILTFQGLKGHHYRVQRSEDLKHWRDVKTLFGQDNEVQVSLDTGLNPRNARIGMFRVLVTPGEPLIPGLDLDLDLVPVERPGIPPLKIPVVVGEGLLRR